MAGYNVSIESLPRCGFLDLRGGEAVREACSTYLDIMLPTVANTMTSTTDDRLAHCISSDHWILQLADGCEAKILQDLELAANGLSHSFVDVSDLYERVQVSGPETREVLSQGISIDLHPRAFPVGSSARTGFAKTTAQLVCLDDSPTYVLTVFSSYLQYVLDWLNMAAATTE
jgi:sarcosine oxidase subunit gamma